ncbi:MAG: tetratricopeptide repeat protein [Myxococcales bacterium]|nr:tetratricopeptide repeat protein [Myxococcales bacterium]MBK7198650.1 tetratricopeptide repeat protein [Myxococcales bacterium]
MAALLILLIALGALAAGVLVGRYYVPDDRALKRRARHAQHYLKALTHHIARDHDVVVAELRKVVDDNVDDSEPYFALAALFRGRGEHERAVRVHQALAVREGASARLRQRALFELGLDFRAAGMPRRAVKALEQVLADDAGHEGALRALCGLYEEQGRFAEAASAWARLGKVQGEPPPRRHHHLLCAAAQQAIAAGDLDSAKQLLREAKGGGESPHFFVVAAELAAARGNARGARERLCQALTAAPELVPYLVPGLATAEAQLAAGDAPPAAAVDELDGDGAAPRELAAGAAAPPASSAERAVAATLDELAERTRSPHLALAAAAALAPIDRAASDARVAAIEAAAPAYLPARLVAARAALAGDDGAALRRELAALCAALAWADGSAWRCRHCGQRGDRFAWRCGGCRRWATAAPELGRERTAAALPPPRERRAERRPSAALLGARADLSLPAGEVEHGLTGAELTARATRRSLLGRVGGWLAGAWPGGRKQP